jgi:hypothetical protein
MHFSPPDDCVAKISIVMPGFVPGIHVLRLRHVKTWMAGTSPAMTVYRSRASRLTSRQRAGGVYQFKTTARIVCIAVTNR